MFSSLAPHPTNFDASLPTHGFILPWSANVLLPQFPNFTVPKKIASLRPHLALSCLLLACPVILRECGPALKCNPMPLMTLSMCLGCPDPCGWTACLSFIMPWTTPCREQATVNISPIPGTKHHSGGRKMAEPGLLGKFLCNGALLSRMTTHC